MRVDLDHVALGLIDAGPVIDTLVGDLGGIVIGGGRNIGFRSLQIRLGRVSSDDDPGEGMTVELLEPWTVDRFDFLARFLEQNGEGPHHLTFKVQGIERHIDRLAEAGYAAVRTNLDNPRWREAFFHPKQTFGTVIQIAESEEREAEPSAEGEGWVPDAWWPTPPERPSRRASLRRVVLRVPDLADARSFFAVLLDGSVESGSGDAVECVWPGGGRLRLELHLDTDPGIDRLECDWEGPAREIGVGGTRVTVAPRG